MGPVRQLVLCVWPLGTWTTRSSRERIWFGDGSKPEPNTRISFPHTNSHTQFAGYINCRVNNLRVSEDKQGGWVVHLSGLSLQDFSRAGQSCVHSIRLGVQSKRSNLQHRNQEDFCPSCTDLCFFHCALLVRACGTVVTFKWTIEGLSLVCEPIRSFSCRYSFRFLDHEAHGKRHLLFP